MDSNFNFVVLGGGTAGLVSSLLIKDKYPTINVTVVKSNDIGIIGVGEGSTEHWKRFMDTIGMNVFELIRETKATIKIGILFNEWNSSPNSYVHSVDGFSINKHGRPDEKLLSILDGINNPYPVSNGFYDLFFKHSTVPAENLNPPSNQFHFDTFALNEYLVKFCKLKGIKFIEGKVNDVLLDEQGFVSSLLMEDTSKVQGDFFIDCSGFRRVIASKVGTSWISKKKHLPLNRAIAFPTEHEFDNFEPYTTSTAMKNGWVWKIPTQERYGNGYVFSDEFCTSEQALEEFNFFFNKKINSVARDIKFEAGIVDKVWNNNVLCVGLSSSFAEPLEAQSIGFTIVHSFTFLEHFDSWCIDKELSQNQYNKKMNVIFDNVIDFIQLHYLGDRDDSSFWKNKQFEKTDFLTEFLPLMKQGRFDILDIDHRCMFKAANFFQVVFGLGMFDLQSIKKMLDLNVSEFNNFLVQQNRKNIGDIKNISRLSHKQYLTTIKNML